MLLGVGEVNTVLTLGLFADKLAKSLIGITRIYEHDVRSLLIVISRHVIDKKRLASARSA